MTAYQAGDLDAFDGVYARLAPIVRRRLAGLARDASWVDDLLQETFMHIHKARATYNSAQPVEPWALGIARHVFLMAHRARRRRHHFDASEPNDAMKELWQPDHEGRCLAAHALERLLAMLGPGSRRAVVLHHLVGLSTGEAGRCLGIRGDAAKLRVCRGVAAMRQQSGAVVRGRTPGGGERSAATRGERPDANGAQAARPAGAIAAGRCAPSSAL